MRGMILAAGFGTRLWPLTEDRTKPAIPFLNKPIVAYCVEYLRDAGIREIIVNLHHRPESVERVLGDGSAFGVSITYSREPEILGTGGAIDKVRDFFGDDDFAVINGKIVTDLDLSSAIEEHRRRGAIATLVLMPNEERERFSIVNVRDDGRIEGFGGFPDAQPASRSTVPLMFTGIQVLSPRLLEYIPRGCFSHTTSTAFPDAIASGELVLANVQTGMWRELSTVARYRSESIEVAELRGESNVIGPRADIAPGAIVVESVLWSDVRVESGAVVRRSVIGDGVRVKSGETIEDSVVVHAGIVDEIERGSVSDGRLVAPIEPVLD